MASIEKRGNAYRITVHQGRDVKGRKVRQTMTWQPPENMTSKAIEREVNRQAVLFEQSCKQGQKVSSAIKFEQYATDYLTTVAPLKLKNGTLTNYRNYSKRIFRAIGHMRLDRVTAREIQRVITDMSEGERYDKYRKGKLSAKTIKNHIAFVSSIFEYAIIQQVLTYNPCRAVVLPKDTAEDVVVYTLEESTRIFELLYSENKKNLHYVLFLTLATYTGFRRGELLGLEWSDFNFDRNIVTLNRQSKYDKSKGIYTDSLKTRASYRCLKLPPEIIALLKCYQQNQSEYIKSIGDKWNEEIKGLNDKIVPNDRLFTQWHGKPMHPNAPSLYFGRFCKRHGITYRKLHSLRHYNATMLIWAGVDPKTVSANLGHSQCSTTTNIYAKVFAQAQAVSMEKLIDVIGLPDVQKFTDGHQADTKTGETPKITNL